MMLVKVSYNLLFLLYKGHIKTVSDTFYYVFTEHKIFIVLALFMTYVQMCTKKIHYKISCFKKKCRTLIQTIEKIN